ncbi:MAG: bifunctional [glutamate--ammonia ligase]-adenylyl-L-tyrosine phosphorylase/[glutamate--ammonia-ligase] adenylyltransferase [Gammaproteobacteria bacterium]|nr:MAG: bifunctional [glutamate--ammonia ligase]-adenylyl-L-tyrosine phosphorylase/[glutamate--ammonia-ligase] adenylyltransferase [Gammaproteobacteria bacterium]
MADFRGISSLHRDNAERLERLEAQWQSLDERPELNEELERQRRCVWLGSDFVARRMLQRPVVFRELVEKGLLARPRDLDEMATELAAWIADVEDEEQLAIALRRFRQREMLRIVWRDLADLAPLNETLSELSELAEVCVRAALDHLYRWMTEKHGNPRDAEGRSQQMVVLGMGKLGARELNLSSDIDLIFCFPRHGHTDGDRRLDNETFFTRLGRRLANLLSRQTEEGFVFRVDMRLRPFGDAGPLVVSFDAMEQYLQAHAREWERYAMVKARPIAGDPEDCRELEALIRAFVYRRYIDFGVIESIRAMKRMIEQELHRKGMEANIKLGEGGIREIEFIGQAFQLVRGGRDAELQVRPIQQVLERLGDKELLPAFAVRQLLEAYAFLRRTENRIQAWRDEQTHLLPYDEAGWERLAVCMGFRNPEDFESALAQHRRQVHSHFEQVFEAPQAEGEHLSPLAPVWLGQASQEERAASLKALGFDDGEGLVQALDSFREGSAVRILSSAARQRLDRLMPLAIEAAGATDHPGQALGRLLRLLEAIVRRTAYLDLLIENPMALSQLVRLLSESVWVGTQLARMPILLDELLDPRSLYRPLRGEDLQEELATLLRSVDPGDLEQEMERLRQFALANRLRVAAADIAGIIPLMVVSDYLTEIAETVLRETRALAWRDLEQRHGRPVLPEPLDSGFLIIGYGKLGGIELGYGSDLDLVFLHGNDNPNAVTEGPKVIANDLFYARLGQRMIHILTTRMPSGVLYEVDMRLRPNGNSGLLVGSLQAFERYQHEDAWTWEHQALVRARAVGGDSVMVEDFNRIRREVLCLPRDPEPLASEVRQMREKMAANLDRGDDAHFDVKQGRGGLVDIEFLVQYAVLRWAHEHPGLTEWSDNARLLERLGEYGLLSPRQAERLFGVYRVYRAVVHRCALQEQRPLLPADRFAEERALVREVWTELLGAR